MGHPILRALGLRLGKFLALVVSSEAIVAVSEAVHLLLLFEEGGEGLPIGVVRRSLAVAERSVHIVQIERGDSASSGGRAEGSPSIVSGCSDVPVCLSAAKVLAVVIAEADPAEVMAALALHVIAATDFLDLHMTFRAGLGEKTRLFSRPDAKIVVAKDVGVRAGLSVRVRFFAASEAEGRGAGAAGARRCLPIDAIQQIPAAADGDAVAVGTGAPTEPTGSHPATGGNERMQLQT